MLSIAQGPVTVRPTSQSKWQKGLQELIRGSRGDTWMLCDVLKNTPKARWQLAIQLLSLSSQKGLAPSVFSHTAAMGVCQKLGIVFG